MAVNVATQYPELVDAVQTAIDRKTKKQQMQNAPDQKWLMVLVEGMAAFWLNHYFGIGPGSRCYDRGTQQHPPVEGIAFDYFDEVWVYSLNGSVVLRLSDGGTQCTVHHI